MSNDKDWKGVRRVDNGWIVADKGLESYSSPKDEHVALTIGDALSKLVERVLPDDISQEELQETETKITLEFRARLAKLLVAQEREVALEENESNEELLN